MQHNIINKKKLQKILILLQINKNKEDIKVILKMKSFKMNNTLY